MPPHPKIRCRQINETDLEAVADLLTRGFPERPRKYWTNGLNKLRTRTPPEGCPRFGHVLEADDAVVGAILAIFSQRGDGPDASIRCNMSSWYVDPAYRAYATLLISAGHRLKQATYLNVSAAAHTLPVIEAQGYRRYSQGQFAALPALSLGRGRASAFDPTASAHRALPEFELIEAHVSADCVAAVCETDQGALPFVFLRRNIAYAPVGVLQLIYCRDTDSFVRCAGALGRFLLGRGVACVLCDAEGPIPGLVGRFFKDKTPRYFKGPDRPRLNDLSHTEFVLFGL